jgi:hypothetical protein
MIEKILKMADEVLNKGSLTSRHSKYQLKHFIVNSEPTHQGRLWQCLKEIDARKESLLQLQNEKLDFEDRVELEEINIQILQRDIEKESDELEDKKKKINLRRAQRSFEALKKTGSKIDDKIKAVVEELDFFLISFTQLEKIESLKEYDDFGSQSEYWSNKFAIELQVRDLFGMPIDPEIIKSILLLDDNSKIKQNLVKQIDNIVEKQKLVTKTT